MRVMTLNVNFYGDKHGRWERRRAMIAEAIRHHAPDLVAFQAVRRDMNREGGTDQATQLAALLPE